MKAYKMFEKGKPKGNNGVFIRIRNSPNWYRPRPVFLLDNDASSPAQQASLKAHLVGKDFFYRTLDVLDHRCGDRRYIVRTESCRTIKGRIYFYWNGEHFDGPIAVDDLTAYQLFTHLPESQLPATTIDRNPNLPGT